MGMRRRGQLLLLKSMRRQRAALKIEFQSLEVRGPDPDVDGAFQAAAKERVNALIVVRNTTARSPLKAHCGLCH